MQFQTPRVSVRFGMTGTCPQQRCIDDDDDDDAWLAHENSKKCTCIKEMLALPVHKLPLAYHSAVHAAFVAALAAGIATACIVAVPGPVVATHIVQTVAVHMVMELLVVARNCHLRNLNTLQGTAEAFAPQTALAA